MSYFDQDRSDVPSYRELRSEQVVARKDHVCRYCRKTIPKGTKYHRLIAMYDGEFTTTASHDASGNCLDVYEGRATSEDRPGPMFDEFSKECDDV